MYDVSGDSYSPNATLTGHTGPIYQLSWSHPKYGPVLASASFDSSVLIHREVRPGEWTLVKAFVGLHDSSVNSVEFAPHEHGLVACAASSDGRVSVLTHDAGDDSWTVEYLRDTPLGVNSASWAPYSVAAAVGEDGASSSSSSFPAPPRMATGGSDNGVRVWRRDATSGTWEQEAFVSSVPGVGHTDWVRDVAWAPGVVPGTSVVASCSEDRTVIVWKQGVVVAVDDDGAGGDGGGGDDGAGEKWTPTLLNTFEDPVWRVSWVSESTGVLRVTCSFFFCALLMISDIRSSPPPAVPRFCSRVKQSLSLRTAHNPVKEHHRQHIGSEQWRFERDAVEGGAGWVVEPSESRRGRRRDGREGRRLRGTGGGRGGSRATGSVMVGGRRGAVPPRFVVVGLLRIPLDHIEMDGFLRRGCGSWA